MEGVDEETLISQIMEDLVKSDPSNTFIRIRSYLGLISVYLRSLSDIRIRSRDPLSVSVRYTVDCPEELGGGRTSKDIFVHALKDRFGKMAWVRIRARLFKVSDLDSSILQEAFRTLLEANYNYTEFSYDIDEDGWVGVTEDIYIPALTYDVFLEEFLAITQAIEFFVKSFAVNFGVKLKCYRERDWYST